MNSGNKGKKSEKTTVHEKGHKTGAYYISISPKATNSYEVGVYVALGQ